MRKLLILMCLLGLVGCATVDSRVSLLEQKVAKLEKQSVMGLATKAGANFYPCRVLSGGVSGSLDKITTPADKDVGFVVLENDATYGNAVFIYVFNASGVKDADELPYIVQPDDSTAGDWELASASTAPPVYLTSARAITPSECRSGVIFLTTVDAATLPAAATVGYGTTVCVISRDAEVATVDLAVAEKFNISGSAKAAGVAITSDGAAGDYWCGVAVTDTGDGTGTTDGWWTIGMGGTAWQ